MDREKMVEEMKKDLSKAFDGNIVLVPRQYLTIEAQKGNGGMGVDINIAGIAEILLREDYRKIPEGAVVLTKEGLVKVAEEGYIYDTTKGGKINIIQIAREIERKETAGEIADWFESISFGGEIIGNRIRKKYGVGVE